MQNTGTYPTDDKMHSAASPTTAISPSRQTQQAENTYTKHNLPTINSTNSSGHTRRTPQKGARAAHPQTTAYPTTGRGRASNITYAPLSEKYNHHTTLPKRARSIA